MFDIQANNEKSPKKVAESFHDILISRNEDIDRALNDISVSYAKMVAVDFKNRKNKTIGLAVNNHNFLLKPHVVSLKGSEEKSTIVESTGNQFENLREFDSPEILRKNAELADEMRRETFPETLITSNSNSDHELVERSTRIGMSRQLVNIAHANNPQPIHPDFYGMKSDDFVLGA